MIHKNFLILQPLASKYNMKIKKNISWATLFFFCDDGKDQTSNIWK